MLSERPLHSRDEIPRRDQVAISTIIFLVGASATMTSARGCHRFAIRADVAASRRSSKRPARTPLIPDRPLIECQLPFKTWSWIRNSVREAPVPVPNPKRRNFI